MRRQAILSLAVFLLFFGGCSRDGDWVKVKGMIRGGAVERVTLLELEAYDSRIVARDRLSRGETFGFRVACEAKGLYLLSADGGEGIVLVLSPGEEVVVEAEGIPFGAQYVVSGSPESEQLQTYVMASQERLRALSHVNRLLIDSRAGEGYAEVHASLTREMERLFREQKRDAEAFIHAHPSSLSSLVVLNDLFGKKPLFREEQDLALMGLLDEGLMQVCPENKHVMEHHRRVARARQEGVHYKESSDGR
ncbi:MAG: hypothetical protein CSA95_03265 [Bacteroidetes bacterium]|nr:MAG: hypothetical protein CSA95_03265 [Bacteroidota bacterium]